MPNHLSKEDEEDFKCNWSTWNRAVITFDTAWSVPYPVMSAFANKFMVPFEHRYFDEGHNFWGIEEWKVEDGSVYRSTKRRSNEDDKEALCMELKGYDPASDEDDEAA